MALVVALLAAGGALVAAPFAHAATCTTSNVNGNCGPYNDAAVFRTANAADLVTQNDFSAIPQTLTAQDSTSWTVAANTDAQGDKTSVKSYPATQVTYTTTANKPEPSATFGSTLTSTWTNINPAGAGQDYEYAFDDWLANPANNSWGNDLEVMIWTDNHGQRPAGNPNGQTYTAPDGSKWDLWLSGGASSVSRVSTVSFVRQGNAASGSLDRIGFYKYLQSNGLLSATYGVDQLNYGLEVCSAGVGTKTYGVSNYSTVVNGAAPTPTPTATTPTPTPTPTTPTPTPTVTTPTPTPANTSPPPPHTGTVAYDSAGSGKKAETNSLTWSQTVGTGPNRALAAEVSVGDGNDRGCFVKLTDNGQPVTELKAVHTNNQHSGVLTVWGLVNPPSGLNTFNVTVSGCTEDLPDEITGGSIAFTGVSPSAPWGTSVGAFGQGTTAAVTAPSHASGMLAGFTANGHGVLSVGSPSTSRFIVNQDYQSGAGNSAGATAPSSGGNIRMAWAEDNDWWAAIAVEAQAA